MDNNDMVPKNVCVDNGLPREARRLRLSSTQFNATNPALDTPSNTSVRVQFFLRQDAHQDDSIQASSQEKAYLDKLQELIEIEIVGEAQEAIPVTSRVQWTTVEKLIKHYDYGVISDITQAFFRCHRGSKSSGHERLTEMVIRAFDGLLDADKSQDAVLGHKALVAMINNERDLTLASLKVRECIYDAINVAGGDLCEQINLVGRIMAYYMDAILRNYSIAAGEIIDKCGPDYFLGPLMLKTCIMSTPEEIQTDPELQLPMSHAIGGILVYSLSFDDISMLDDILSIFYEGLNPTEPRQVVIRWRKGDIATGHIMSFIDDAFKIGKFDSGIFYPKAVTVMSPTNTSQRLIIIEGSTSVLKEIDIEMKEFLTQYFASVVRQRKPVFMIVKISALNPRYWALSTNNPYLQKVDLIVRNKRRMRGLSQTQHDHVPYTTWGLLPGVVYSADAAKAMGIFDTHEKRLLTTPLLQTVVTNLTCLLEDDSHNLIQLLKGHTTLAELKAVEKSALDKAKADRIANQVPSRQSHGDEEEKGDAAEVGSDDDDQLSNGSDDDADDDDLPHESAMDDDGHSMELMAAWIKDLIIARGPHFVASIRLTPRERSNLERILSLYTRQRQGNQNHRQEKAQRKP